jgi:beta-aspartyl-peptidase (threonine type)
VIGAGTHADDACGAASATGPGEAILRITLTFRATARLGLGMAAEAAAREALTELEARVGGTGGIILVDRRGGLGLARTTEAMPWAARWDGGEEAGS